MEEIENYKINGKLWYYDLENTKQDSDYHAEGNVWIHTKLVVESLFLDEEYINLEKNEQKILLLSALLHDIAKPFCTKEEDGKITSPNHTLKGSLYARNLFYRYNFMSEIFGVLSFEEREQVCSLIRYHGFPIYFDEKENPKKETFKCALEINIKHLAILARADFNGRKSLNKSENLTKIELFVDMCKQWNCYDTDEIFLSDTSKMMYFRNGEQYLNYIPYEEKQSTVYLLSGIPASGKDTYIRNNFNGMDIISLDELREKLNISPKDNQGKVIQEAKKQAKILLANKTDFVWNATNTTTKMRTQIISMFLDYNAKVNIIYIETPYKTLLQRNSKRKAPVPNDVIDRLVSKLEPPKLWEANNVTYMIN